MGPPTIAAAFALALALSGCAAQPAMAPPPTTPPPSAQARPTALTGVPVRVEVDSGQSKALLREGDSGRSIVGPQGRLYRDGTLAPKVVVTPTPHGYDAVYTFSNTTDGPLTPALLEVPAIHFGPDATWYDFRRGSEPSSVTHAGRGLRVGGHLYPSDLDSPVAVLADERLSIGASLLYDPLKARHEVRTILRTGSHPPTDEAPFTAGGKAWLWMVLFELDTTIAPHTTASYTLAVRVAPADRWIETLTPYAQHFQRTFGPVAYTRDPRHVLACAIADASARSDQNPRGFTYRERRPDLNGFAPWVRTIATHGVQGHPRVMVWALSGLHRAEALNYPPNFATGLRASPRAEQTAPLLAELGDRGMTLGLWWGRSQQVIEGFDSDRIETLDPWNPEHVAKALAELDAARALGATEIGLDAYAKLPAWEAVEWLQTLQRHAPEVRFILEPSPCDLLHRLAPAYVDAQHLTVPDLLADLVLPGHETWAQVRFDQLRKAAGRALSDQEKQLEARRVAGLGLVPVLFDVVPVPAGGMDAAP